MRKISIAALFTVILVLAMITFSCEKSEPAGELSTMKTTPETDYADLQMKGHGPGNGQCQQAADSLDAAEIEALAFIREEELMARDIYLAMYSTWNHKIFSNIAHSEQAHANAILKLLQKYQLPDPAANHQAGVFTNPDIQALYDALLAQGNQSLVDAFYVGATIEDYDIFDIQSHLTEVDHADLIQVFNNLLNGSKSHLRAFNKQLVIRGVTYVPQYITQAEFDAIVQ